MSNIIPFAPSRGYDDPVEPEEPHPYDQVPIWDPWFDKPDTTSTEPARSAVTSLPSSSNPDQIVMVDGTIVCSIWCSRGDGHPEATDQVGQICRSPQIRLTPAAGGGRTGHTRPASCRCGTAADCPAVPWADAEVSISAEQFPNEPPMVILATEVAGVEQHVTLTIDEVDKVATDLLLLGMRIESQHD